LQPYQDPPLDQQLANSLPLKDHFATLISGILNFLSGHSPGAATAIALRTLAITNDYEFGQAMIKNLLRKRPSIVPDFCSKFSSEFSKVNPVSIKPQELRKVLNTILTLILNSFQDHLNCISSLEMFLQACLNENGFNKVLSLISMLVYF
jgi:hypothetical protein